MTPFPLKIVTPDGLQYDQMAEELIVRTTSGDIGILAGHVNCVAPWAWAGPPSWPTA